MPVLIEPTPTNATVMQQMHAVSPEIADMPFIELSMFLYNKLDGVPPGELDPMMLSTWIQEHAVWAERHRRTKLAYTVASHGSYMLVDRDTRG